MSQDITLRDGRTTAPLAVVLAAMQPLRRLRQQDQSALAELIDLCFKPSSFESVGVQNEILFTLGLVTSEGGQVRVRGLVYAIILSCMDGEGEWVHELPYEIAIHETF